MRFGPALYEGVADSESKFQVFVAAVKNYGNDFSVGVFEGDCLNLASPLTASDSLRATLYIFAEVSNIVIGIVNVDVARLSVYHNRRVAEVSNVVGAALFIEE